MVGRSWPYVNDWYVRFGQHGCSALTQAINLCLVIITWTSHILLACVILKTVSVFNSRWVNCVVSRFSGGDTFFLMWQRTLTVSTTDLHVSNRLYIATVLRIRSNVSFAVITATVKCLTEEAYGVYDFHGYCKFMTIAMVCSHRAFNDECKRDEETRTAADLAKALRS